MKGTKNTTMRNKVVSGMIWLFGERISAQLVSMIVTVILARLLTPEHYGMISVVTVFITFSNVFVTSGFSTALIQKKEADDLDFDTTFVLSLVISVVLYAVLFFSAPLIAVFYEIPLLTPVIRVMAIKLPLAALNSVQRSYLQRDMRFKQFFKVTMGGTLASAALGIGAAAAGLGVWALVIQQISNTLIGSILLFFACEWNPKFRFSFVRIKAIWQFGWKALLTHLVVSLQDDIRSLIVGKVFGPADLAYYDQGKKYPSLLMTNINAAINKVMLSAYSREQDNKARVLAMLRRSVSVGAYIIVPLMLGFAAVAEPFVKMLLTEKWLPCVPFLQIFCICFITRPLESCSYQALLSIGKSGASLIAIVIVNIAVLISVCISVFLLHSVLAIALLSLVTTLISLICWLSFANYHLGYKLKMQIQDFVPSLAAGATMFASVWLIGYLPVSELLLVVIQVMLGVAVYVAISVLFKMKAFVYVLEIVRRKH